MVWRRPGNKLLSEPMMISLQRIYASLGLNELNEIFEISAISLSHFSVYKATNLSLLDQAIDFKSTIPSHSLCSSSHITFKKSLINS